MSSIIKLRWYNLVGGIIFTFYGFAIHSLPVGFLNLFIVCTNIYYLNKIYRRKEAFQLVEVTPTDAYFNYFLQFNMPEIATYFPSFKLNDISDVHSEHIVSFLLLRDAMPAGVFLGTKENETLQVLIDFVTAPYRDLKPGDFIYKKNTTFFIEKSISKIQIQTNNKLHIGYLQKMGFKKNNTLNAYFLELI